MRGRAGKQPTAYVLGQDDELVADLAEDLTKAAWDATAAATMSELVGAWIEATASCVMLDLHQPIDGGTLFDLHRLHRTRPQASLVPMLLLADRGCGLPIEGVEDVTLTLPYASATLRTLLYSVDDTKACIQPMLGTRRRGRQLDAPRPAGWAAVEMAEPDTADVDVADNDGAHVGMAACAMDAVELAEADGAEVDGAELRSSFDHLFEELDAIADLEVDLGLEVDPELVADLAAGLEDATGWGDVREAGTLAVQPEASGALEHAESAPAREAEPADLLWEVAYGDAVTAPAAPELEAPRPVSPISAARRAALPAERSPHSAALLSDVPDRGVGPVAVPAWSAAVVPVARPGVPVLTSAAQGQVLVLIADADEDVVELLAAHGQLAGWAVCTATDGGQAEWMLRTGTIDVAVIGSDLCRGEMLRRVRSDGLCHDTRFVALSADARPEEMMAAFVDGYVEFITKPFDPKVASARIEQVAAAVPRDWARSERESEQRQLQSASLDAFEGTGALKLRPLDWLLMAGSVLVGVGVSLGLASMVI